MEAMDSLQWRSLANKTKGDMAFQLTNRQSNTQFLESPYPKWFISFITIL